MAVISWGKPTILIGATNPTLGASNYAFKKISTPAEDTTNLTATQGDKTEALIEGGEAEATKYKAATFELTMNVRMAKNRHLPDVMLDDSTSTGYASNVSVVLQPEDPAAPGFFCPTCALSVIESYTSADGAMWEITLNPNVPTSGKAVQWGTITVAEGTSTNAGKYSVVKADIGTGDE